MSEQHDKLAELRKPFPVNQISKLPKETRNQIDARKADRNLMVWKCAVCGGAHHKDATHLDYVGHAALTDRLLDTDIEWTWEPLAFNEKGLPALDVVGGLWIRLTVQGVTRLGYGSADGKQGGDAIKEMIGDALRNAAMRFGAALDLWHKGDLHVGEEMPEEKPATKPARAKPEPLSGKPYRTRAEARVGYGEIVRELHACGDGDQLRAYLETIADARMQFEKELPEAWNGDGADFNGLKREIELAELRVNENGNDWRDNPLLGG